MGKKKRKKHYPTLEDALADAKREGVNDVTDDPDEADVVILMPVEECKYVAEGSIKVPCDKCGTICWMAPMSEGVPHRACFRCVYGDIVGKERQKWN